MRFTALKRRILNAGAIWISYVKLIPDLLKLNKNSLVLDCGANVGHISKLLSRTGATVISFEPDPVAFARLKKRCGHIRNIQLIQKGVWDKPSTLQLYTHKDADQNDVSFTVGSSIVAAKKNVDTSRSVEVEVIDLVEFMKQAGRKIDLIKLDVEGAEIEILNKVIATEAYQLFGKMYVETHEKKIPEQVAQLAQIRKQIAEKGIGNIYLNWI